MERKALVSTVTDQVLRLLEREGGVADHPYTRCTPCQLSGHCASNRYDVVDALFKNGASRVSTSLGGQPARQGLASRIDHTLLKADATRHQVAELCLEAKQHEFASCCVNPYFVPLAAELLRGSPVRVCTVIGFPLGASATRVKAQEARNAMEEGAEELDMVINIGSAKVGDFDVVERDIRAVVDVAAGGALVKVIIETALLTDEEKIRACMAARVAGADYVKTSTGFSKAGATLEDVMLMRRVVGQESGRELFQVSKN